MRHQTYPESLEHLVGEAVTKVPIDPFIGKAFHYQREENGFVVYSVGENGVDDGGVLETDRPNFFLRDVGWRFSQ
jgi:hypothetical protein